MEISITWNICRVCLQEEIKNEKDLKTVGKHHSIFDNSVLAKNIFTITGVEMKENDGLPGKICPKCLKILKLAVYFRKTCRQSDTNLQSVIQRTKSASSMFKQERRKDVLMDSNSADDPLYYEVDYENDAETSSAGFNETEDEDEHKSQDHNQKENNAESHLHSNVKTSEEKHNAQLFPETLTVKYENDRNKTDVLTTEVDSDGSEVNDNMENTEINSNQIIIHDDEETAQPVHEEHLDNSLELNHNRSKIEPCNLQTNYTKFASSTQSLVSKIIEESDLTDDEINHMQEETETNTLKAHNDGLYYILNNIKVDGNSQDHDVDEGNDNVDFVPIDDDDDMQQNIVEAHDEDVDENRSQVTSTVVTKEEIDFDDGSSNVSQNTQNVDEEFIVDEYIIDDCNESVKHNTSSLHSKISLSAKNKHFRKGPIISRRHGSTQATSTIQHLVCELCGNNFTSRQLMNIHMKIHRQEKKHECELCFKRFISACNLQAHMRIHTGEKPYECKFCSRRFSDRSTHIRHERIHTNEKPFTCDSCGKAFALATTLQAHLKVHTGERPYRCEPCAKSFKLPHQLKAHQNTSLHKAVEEQLGHECISS